MIDLQTARGTARAYLATPRSGHGPGVLVLHAWWGLTPFMTSLCERLAEAGFVALAPDLFQGKTASAPAEAEALVAEQEADDERISAVLFAALDELRGHGAARADGTAVVGFSFGAAWALLLSTLRPEDVRKVVVFYGAYAPDLSPANAAYLGHFAENDPFEPAESVRELEAALRAAGRPAQFHLYPGTGHWFFESDRPGAYDGAAADLAWQRTLDFLRAE